MEDHITYRACQQEPKASFPLIDQYRRLPSPQRRQYRRDALQDAALIYDPTPDQRQMFLDFLAEIKK